MIVLARGIDKSFHVSVDVTFRLTAAIPPRVLAGEQVPIVNATLLFFHGMQVEPTSVHSNPEPRELPQFGGGHNPSTSRYGQLNTLTVTFPCLCLWCRDLVELVLVVLRT